MVLQIIINRPAGKPQLSRSHRKSYPHLLLRYVIRHTGAHDDVIDPSRNWCQLSCDESCCRTFRNPSHCQARKAGSELQCTNQVFVLRENINYNYSRSVSSIRKVFVSNNDNVFYRAADKKNRLNCGKSIFLPFSFATTVVVSIVHNNDAAPFTERPRIRWHRLEQLLQSIFSGIKHKKIVGNQKQQNSQL